MDAAIKFNDDLLQKINESEAIGGKPSKLELKIRNRENNSVRVAIESVTSGNIHEGLVRLVKMGRTDLSLEQLVIDYADSKLFTKDIVECAKWRLAQAQDLATES